MRINLIIVLSILGITFVSGQNELRVIDIAFGKYALLSNVTYSAQYIDNNEPHRVFNHLSQDYNIEYDSIQNISDSVAKFKRKSSQSYPAMMLQENDLLDTMYYERHYYLIEKNEVQFIAQLILKFVQNGNQAEITDIEYLNSGTYLNRKTEIKSFHDKIWHKKVKTFKPTNEVDYELQSDYSSSSKISRDLNTLYSNAEERIGLNYTTQNWKLDSSSNIRTEDINEIFGLEYHILDILKNESSKIEIGKTKSGTIIQNNDELLSWLKDLLNLNYRNNFQLNPIEFNEEKNKIATSLTLNQKDTNSTIKLVLLSVHPYVYIVSINSSGRNIIDEKEIKTIANSFIYK